MHIGSHEDAHCDLSDEPLMTLDEWVTEFYDNACCPDAIIAARRECGCAGSAQIPSNIARTLRQALTIDL